jgi:hypothetical protein
VELLSTRRLYFARVDLLDDPYEGAYTRPQTRAARRRGAARDDGPYPQFDPGTDLRRYVYANCWYVNPHESAAMWRLYGRSAEGLAVRTTFGALAESLRAEPRLVSAGRVRYLDYQADRMPTDQGLMPFMCKRRSFEYENELRLLHYDEPAHDAGGDGDTPPALGMAADLNVLIGDVLLAPTAEDWLVELAETVAGKFGVEKPVGRSDLATGPLY